MAPYEAKKVAFHQFLVGLLEQYAKCKSINLDFTVAMVTKLNWRLWSHRGPNILNKSENATLQLSIFCEKVLDKKSIS